MAKNYVVPENSPADIVRNLADRMEKRIGKMEDHKDLWSDEEETWAFIGELRYLADQYDHARFPGQDPCLRVGGQNE